LVKTPRRVRYRSGGPRFAANDAYTPWRHRPLDFS
jgi:hypothetical protein